MRHAPQCETDKFPGKLHGCVQLLPHWALEVEVPPRGGGKQVTEEELVVRLTRAEERTRRNEERLSALEATTDALQKIATSIEVIATEQQHIKSDVHTLNAKVAATEARPAKLWDRMIAGLIGAAASGVVALILTHLGLS
jgi:predicted lipid-binding transport protein (Tim44 family)